MDNPLSSKLSADNLLQKIVTDIKGCISEMKQEFEEYGLCPLTDDSSSLSKFCAKLELLLQFGIRERSGIFGGAKGYWNYMQECLSNNKNLKDGLRFVKARSELKTNAGRGRALIRFSLVHHRLADTLQYCLMNTLLNSEWYTVKSLFNHKKLAGDLLIALYDLNDLQFDLDPRDAELDTCWPTFARKGPGVVFNWRPPSRSGSIASLSSIPNLEVYPSMSFAMSPNIKEDNAFTADRMSFDSSDMLRDTSNSEEDMERMRQLVDEMTAKYDEASKRIKELEIELDAKESSNIREIEIETKATFNGEQPAEKPPDVLEAEEVTSNEKLKEDVSEEGEVHRAEADVLPSLQSSAEDSNVSPQTQSSVKANLSESCEVQSSAESSHLSSEVQSSVKSSHLSSEVQSSVKSSDLSSEVRGAKEHQANEVKDENRDDAYLSTITSLQQQLMVAVNAREHLSEELSLARVEVERLTNIEVKAQLLQREISRLSEEVELLNRELREAREERNHVELRSREDNFFEKAFGDAMKDKASAEASMEELQMVHCQLSGKFETSENLRQELEKRLEIVVAEKQNLVDRVSELEKIDEEQKSGILRLQLEATTAEKQIAELELVMALGRNTTQELENKFKEAYDEISKGNDESQRILDEKEKLCATLEKEKSEMDEKLREAVMKSEERDKEVSELRTKVSELEELLESNRISSEELNSKTKILEESIQKTQTELDEVLETKDSLAIEKESLAEELQQKSENLEQNTIECQELLDKLKEMEEKLESEKNSSKTLIVEKEKLIADLEEDLDSLSGSVQRREKMWENARESMEGDMLEKAGRIQTLEQLVADGSTKQKLVELEKKKEELEDALGAVRLELEIDQDRARVQLDDLKQCLGHLEHEKFQMQDQLKERDELIEKERTSFVKSQQKWEEESRKMNEDLQALKKRIIKLVREKAELWQKTDDLTYEQKVKASYQWMNSADVTNCLICHSLFSVTVRKHHCRKCGRVFCHNCCNNWVMLPHSKIKERICNECQMDMSLLLETTVNSTADAESDTESYSEQPTSTNSREPTPANNREPAPDNSMEPASANNREPVLSYSREPVLANNREPANSMEPASADGLWSPASGEPVLSERRESVDETYSSIFRGDSDAETDARSHDRCFDERGVEPAELDVKSMEPVLRLHSDDSPFEARSTEEVLPSVNSENGEDVGSLVETRNGAEALQKVEDSGELDESIIQTAVSDDTAIGDTNPGSSTAWSLTGSAKAAVSWVSSAASATTSLASGLLPKQLKSSPREHSSLESAVGDASGIDGEPDSFLPGAESHGHDGLTSEKRGSGGDLFDLISPEEISESRLWPTPDPNVLCGTVVKLCDAEVEGVMIVSENELLIKAGKCFAIPVSIEVIGLKLSWEFSTRPKGISFAVLYKESDAIPREDCVSLIPLTRLNSHQQTVTGELKAKKLGVYTLFFDNLASRFTAKKLKYKLQAEMSEATHQDVDDVRPETSHSDMCHETTDVIN